MKDKAIKEAVRKGVRRYFLGIILINVVVLGALVWKTYEWTRPSNAAVQAEVEKQLPEFRKLAAKAKDSIEQANQTRKQLERQLAEVEQIKAANKKSADELEDAWDKLKKELAKASGREVGYVHELMISDELYKRGWTYRYFERKMDLTVAKLADGKSSLEVVLGELAKKPGDDKLWLVVDRVLKKINRHCDEASSVIREQNLEALSERLDLLRPELQRHQGDADDREALRTVFNWLDGHVKNMRDMQGLIDVIQLNIVGLKKLTKSKDFKMLQKAAQRMLERPKK